MSEVVPEDVVDQLIAVPITDAEGNWVVNPPWVETAVPEEDISETEKTAVGGVDMLGHC